MYMYIYIYISSLHWSWSSKEGCKQSESVAFHWHIIFLCGYTGMCNQQMFTACMMFFLANIVGYRCHAYIVGIKGNRNHDGISST